VPLPLLDLGIAQDTLGNAIVWAIEKQAVCNPRATFERSSHYRRALKGCDFYIPTQVC